MAVILKVNQIFIASHIWAQAWHKETVTDLFQQNIFPIGSIAISLGTLFDQNRSNIGEGRGDKEDTIWPWILAEEGG